MSLKLNCGNHSTTPSMLVVVHDFSSVFLSELNHIAEQLEPIVGQQMSAAIVPRWRGNRGCTANSAYRDLLMRFSEQLLHGWTHQSGGRMRPLSLLTGASDEFGGLDEASILERLEFAQADFRELTGKHAEGFLPPAWQLPLSAFPTSVSEVRDVLPLSRILLGSWQNPTARNFVVGLGAPGWLGYGADWISRLPRRTSDAAIPCIAIHPIDVVVAILLVPSD